MVLTIEDKSIGEARLVLYSLQLYVISSDLCNLVNLSRELSMVKTRLAKGEITEEQYLQLRKLMSGY
jgi:uncharacterized membrane protein